MSTTQSSSRPGTDPAVTGATRWSRTTRRLWHAIDGRRQHSRDDRGQAALVLVVALTVVMTTVGGVMVSNIVNNDPILKQASIQRYAYRALASGLNAYQSVINANPYLAACNSNTNVGGANAQAACAGIGYQTWSQVPGTDTGNGVIPEYYKFDNPEEIIDPTTQALLYLEVQIVGGAGFSGKDVYYSTVAKFTPSNGFLDNVWWTNYESSPSNGQPLSTSNSCSFYWATSYANSGNCTPVYFTGSDSITGPVFSNDSIFVDNGPNFGSGYGVTTADPKCLFVDQNDGTHGKPPSPAGSNTNCALASSQDVGSTHYSAALSSFGAGNLEPIPQDNLSLKNYAKQGGCYYTGPTQVTLSAAGMVVSSPGTTHDGTGDSNGTSHLNDLTSDASVCPVNNSTPAALPLNGVIYVDQDPTPVAGANPFDGVVVTSGCPFGHSSCTIDNQTSVGSGSTNPSCSGCYYGQTGTPDAEGDAFVRGNLSGHLTVGADNDVIIDGALKYADCTWVGTPSQSNCNYNNSSTGINDTLGLIAYNYVEINRPISSPGGNILSNCTANGAEPAPLCDPAGTGQGGLTVDASLLGLQQSFIVNNYDQGGLEGSLTVYGSIQQDARGPVGTFNSQTGAALTGYGKQYLWDPRLPLYSPPFYLTPGTSSWALTSSSESYTGTQPVCPGAQTTPTKANGTVTYPYPAYPPAVGVNGTVAAGTGSCVAAS